MAVSERVTALCGTPAGVIPAVFVVVTSRFTVETGVIEPKMVTNRALTAAIIDETLEVTAEALRATANAIDHTPMRAKGS